MLESFIESIIKTKILSTIEQFNYKELKEACKKNISLLKLSLKHIPEDMQWGRNLAKLYPRGKDIITNEKVLEWLKEDREDLFVYCSKDEINYILRNIQDFKNYFWS